MLIVLYSIAHTDVSPFMTLPASTRFEGEYIGVTAGYDSTCLLSDHGNTYCVGRSDYGQLGRGKVLVEVNYKMLINLAKIGYDMGVEQCLAKFSLSNF